MSTIKARTRGRRLIKHNVRLDEQNRETLYAYAHFLGESTEYVLNQLIDCVLAKDKDFVRRRADHPQTWVPRPAVRPPSDAHRSEPMAAVPTGWNGTVSPTASKPTL
jgi:hypothetical protein